MDTVWGPGTVGHALANFDPRRMRVARLREEVGDELIREKIRKENRPVVPGLTDEVKKRGKVFEEDIAALLDVFPIGKRKLDGSLVRDARRLKWLKEERRVVIDRTTLSKRLKPYRHSPATP
jgi:hypothetical protein